MCAPDSGADLPSLTGAPREGSLTRGRAHPPSSHDPTVTDSAAQRWQLRVQSGELGEDPTNPSTWVRDELWRAAIHENLGVLPLALTNGAHPDAPTHPLFQPLLDAQDDPPQWLAQDFLPANEYALIAGEGGSFKTTVFLAILGAVAGGYDVLNGFPTGEPRNVLLISGEDSMGVLKNRLQAIIKGHGWDAERIRPHLHAIALRDVLLSSPQWQADIEESALQLAACLLGLDPLADLIDFDENDNSSARPVIQWFRRLGTFGITPLLCHHYGKATEHKQGMARIRGASAWMNAARAIYTIEEKDGTRWLGCGKLSRATRPEPRELRIEIQHEEGNRAVWTEARVALAHPPQSSWALKDQRELSPAERIGLEALERHVGESLSWSKWQAVSGLAESSLSAVIPRLKKLRYVVGSEAGKRFGKPVFMYDITTLGRNAILPTPRLHPDSINDSMVSHPHDSTTPSAPLGGGVVVSVELPLAEEIAAFYSDEAMESQSGPKPPPHEIQPEDEETT